MKFLRIPFSDCAHIRGKVVYMQNGKSADSGALEKDGSAELKILLPRQAGVVSVYAVFHNESFTSSFKLAANYIGYSENFDEYRVDISGIYIGLYFFEFELCGVFGTAYGMKGKGRELVLSQECGANRFQLTICDFAYSEPTKYLGGVIYHIFVDRFSRGGNVPVRDDAVLYDTWDGGIPEYPEYPGAHLENNTFFGGTLWGVIDKLDYIASLGTTIIYLSPVFEAYSNHKYDTGDYMKVDDMFGGDEALRTLIRKAAERGIGIVLDGVFNHTGADSVYFNMRGRYPQLGAYQSKSSPYYSWYDFQNYPNKYTCWWDIPILPRINPDVADCGDFIAGEGGVIDKYAKMGIAGMRLDVADELSDAFIARIKHRLDIHNRDSVLYGEVWEDASNKIAYDKRKRYYLGTELDGVMNYPLRRGIIDFLRFGKTDALRYALDEVTFNAPTRVRNMQMNLLGTHDTERIITTLAGKSSLGRSNEELSVLYLDKSERERGIKLVRMAYTILATVPGIPTVFYGDEVGLEGYSDPFNRRPYPWSSFDGDLLSFYRKIGSVRRAHDVYKSGNFSLITLTENMLIFERSGCGEYCYTVVNNSSDTLSLSLSSVTKALVGGGSGSTVTLAPLECEILCATRKIEFKIK